MITASELKVGTVFKVGTEVLVVQKLEGTSAQEFSVMEPAQSVNYLIALYGIFPPEPDTNRYSYYR